VCKPGLYDIFYITGVWKPGIQHSPQAPSFTEKSQTEGNQSPSLKEIPQRWSPGGPSNTAHKGYRPIRTDFSRAPSNISAVSSHVLRKVKNKKG
jgi:hypothetical protein